MAESSGRAGKSSGSGAGKGAVSAEQVRSGEGGRGQPGRARRRRERRAACGCCGPHSSPALGAAHGGEGRGRRQPSPAGEWARWELKAAPPWGVG